MMQVPTQFINILFDSIILLFAAISLFICILTLIFMFLSKEIRRKNDETINNLLTKNTFVTIICSSVFLLSMYIRTLYGHINVNMTNGFDGWWCYFLGYLLYSCQVSFMYSLFIHALYRYIRIVFPNSNQQNSERIYQLIILVKWVISFLLVLICYLLNDIRYVNDDSNCQIEVVNLRGMVTIIPIGYVIPSNLITICYVYTLYFYRKSIRIRNDIRQRTRTHRDILVLKRISTIITFVNVTGLPTLLLCILSAILGQLPWWTRPFGWLTLSFAYGSVPFILILVSPQLKRLFVRRFNRIHPIG